MTDFEPTPYFTLDPHVEEYDPEHRLIPIDVIATRVYGNKFDSLRACQADYDNISNGATVVYELAGDSLEEWLDRFDEKEVSLGYCHKTKRSVYKAGLTEMEYWQSISYLSDDEDEQVDDVISPEELETLCHFRDTMGAAFHSDAYAYARGQLEDFEAGKLKVAHVNPTPGTDLENAVFKDAFYANRAFSPSLGSVLADLVRRGELPEGNYLYLHNW